MKLEQTALSSHIDADSEILLQQLGSREEVGLFIREKQLINSHGESHRLKKTPISFPKVPEVSGKIFRLFVIHDGRKLRQYVVAKR